MGGPAHIGGKVADYTDNFYVAPFYVDNVKWMTVEHYYQAQKFVDKASASIYGQIQGALTAQKAWSIAQSHASMIRADWGFVKVNVMYVGVKAKFDAHPSLAANFAATRGKIVSSWSTHDWQHWNSIILERVRLECRSPAEQNGERYAALVAKTSVKLQGQEALDYLRIEASSSPMCTPSVFDDNALTRVLKIADQRHAATNPDVLNLLRPDVEKCLRQEGVIIFSKSYCDAAKSTKLLLGQLGLEIKIIELDRQHEGALGRNRMGPIQQLLGEKSGGILTVPQVFVKGKFVGGNDEIIALKKKGILRQTLINLGAEEKRNNNGVTEEKRNNNGVQNSASMNNTIVLPSDWILNISPNLSIRGPIASEIIPG